MSHRGHSLFAFACGRGPGAQRGVPRSGLWSEEELASSGMAVSGRKIANVAEWNPSRARVLSGGIRAWALRIEGVSWAVDAAGERELGYFFLPTKIPFSSE